MISLNLEEGQIAIQIVSSTQIRGTISEYNMLVCQVGSEQEVNRLEDRVWGKCIVH